MTTPLLLQFLSTIYKWIRLEKKESKRWSWILLLLQFWPQWRALRVIRLDFKKDPKAEIKKKELRREVTSTEPFLEAWPSICIMTIIWLSAKNDTQLKSSYETESLNPSPEFCEKHPDSNKCAVFSGFGGAAWFFTTYAISIITCSLGITKFLQVGPFAVLNANGPFGGILNWRFVLAFLAVGSAMLSKCVLVGLLFPYIIETQKTTVILFFFVLLIVPNLVYSLISIAYSTGISKKWQVYSRYPAAWMLPVATYFIIGPTKSTCCSPTNNQRHYLGFSKHCSIINMILTGIVHAIMITYYQITINHTNNQVDNFLTFQDIVRFIFIPTFIIGLIFNCIYLSLDSLLYPCGCLGSQNSFASFCCGPQCYKTDIYVIDTGQKELEIVQIDD